jgi:hypothetical protein
MGVEFAVIAAVAAVVLVLVARVWRGDRRRDRGAMSGAMATRGDLAALGGTIDDDRHGHDHGEHGDVHGEHGHDHSDDAGVDRHRGA